MHVASVHVSPAPVRESQQVLVVSPSTRVPRELRSRRNPEASRGDTPPVSPSRARARVHYSHSPSPKGSTVCPQRRNSAVPRASVQHASPRAASRGVLPGGAGNVGVVRQSSNGNSVNSVPGVRNSQATVPSFFPTNRQVVDALFSRGMSPSPQAQAQEDAKLRCKVVPTRKAVQPPPACSSRWAQGRSAEEREAPELNIQPSGGCRQSPVRCGGGASHLWYAANSEDMERRSIDGSAVIALAAFDRELAEVTSQVQAVSLGGSCGPKISLRRLGLGEATMPFDWMRTRVQGLIHWLRSGFDDFLNTHQRLEVNYQDTLMTVFRSPTHSFWHDDLQDEVCREKLKRRVDRFLALTSKEVATDVRDLLFVRGVAGSSELELTEELYKALVQRFEGRRVWLLLVLEDQPILGPVMHSNHDRLVMWVQPRFEGKVSTDVGVPSPYEDAIAFTVRHILGDRGGLYPGEEAEEWPVIDQAIEILTPGSTFWNAGCRPTEVGLWVGHAQVNGSRSEVLMSAFQGFDHVEGYPPQGVCMPPTGIRAPQRVIFGMPRNQSRELTPARNMALSGMWRTSPNYAVVAAH